MDEPTTDLAALGQTIKETRLASGLSQVELAELAGISASYVRAIEQAVNPKTRRPTRPSVKALLKIGRSLGVDETRLLELAGHPTDGVEKVAAGGRSAHELAGRVAAAVPGVLARGPFLRGRATERLEDFAADFEAISSGVLRCLSVDEPLWTRLAISEARRQIRAVCFEDEEWWDNHGDVYLRMHEHLRAEEVSVVRIFIADPEAKLHKLRNVLERHMELGLEAYVLDRASVPDRYWRNFVVYDDVLVRSAYLTSSAAGQKVAEFSDEPSRINQAIRDFESLYERARSGPFSAQDVL